MVDEDIKQEVVKEVAMLSLSYGQSGGQGGGGQGKIIPQTFARCEEPVNVMGISQCHKKEKNMTQSGNMGWTEKSKYND